MQLPHFLVVFIMLNKSRLSDFESMSIWAFMS